MTAYREEVLDRRLQVGVRMSPDNDLMFGAWRVSADVSRRGVEHIASPLNSGFNRWHSPQRCNGRNIARRLKHSWR
jgi:hypothetical protein